MSVQESSLSTRSMARTTGPLSLFEAATPGVFMSQFLKFLVKRKGPRVVGACGVCRLAWFRRTEYVGVGEDAGLLKDFSGDSGHQIRKIHVSIRCSLSSYGKLGPSFPT